MSNLSSKIILKNGEKVLLRKMEEAEAAAFHQYIIELFASSDYVLTSPEEFKKKTVEETRKRFFSPTPFRLNFCAFADKDPTKIIGNIDLGSSETAKMKHVGWIGMGILNPYRNQGLGQEMFKHLLKNADLYPQIQRLELEVMKSNQGGVALYKKIGFVVEGVKRKAYKQPDGSMEDSYLMSLLRDEFPKF